MTKRINGGINGLTDRRNRWNKALGLFSISDSGASNQPRVYKVNDTGGMIRRIQSILGITADGVFGDNTKAAVRQYQIRKGLTPDGIVGPATLRKMGITNG